VGLADTTIFSFNMKFSPTKLSFSSLVAAALLAFPSTAHSLPHVRDDHGAVASSDARCSDIGIEAMKDGGNAADAVSYSVGSTIL
jgi:gamma-glutamyltranspeptidase